MDNNIKLAAELISPADLNVMQIPLLSQGQEPDQGKVSLRINGDEIFMAFPQPQREATFLRRPQRFLAEMVFPDGIEELVYCANPGSMTGCLTSGKEALLWDSADLKRKRRYTWRAVELEGLWIGTDNHLSNRLVEEALRLKLVPGLETYNTLAREQLVEDGFRVDFIITGFQGDCLVEVKSATVVENGVARYPDSLTPRGVKHLKSLKRKAAEGQRNFCSMAYKKTDLISFCRYHPLPQACFVTCKLNRVGLQKDDGLIEREEGGA